MRTLPPFLPLVLSSVVLALLVGCGAIDAAARPPASTASAPAVDPDHQPAPLPQPGPNQAVASFAGGCFWCMESDMDKLPGIVETTSGFAGGTVANPTYEDVTTETTGHREAVRVIYDTTKLTYNQVLDWYWHHIDPTDDGGQFCDRGDSYRTAIFVSDDTQRQLALASKKALDDKGVLPGPIVTQILGPVPFYAAEVYHQDFHDKSPVRYQSYRAGCGRDARVAEVWAKDPLSLAPSP